MFITSPTERALYTGQIMAKLLKPSALLRVRKVALCLRASDELYRSAGRLDMRFFPLGPDSAAAIAEFNPDLLIAPSQVLLALASAHKLPDLKHLYYGAETLNDTERAFIGDRLGVRPDPIYQATEGFLGAPCRLGTLHLNEDALIIERDPLPGGRFRPIVTDLLRRTQAIVRLRLDDVLEPTTCLCGSARAAVRPVEGRIQDIWRWSDQQVFPRDVENRMAPLIPADHPWVATGHPKGVRLACRKADASRLAEALSVFGQPVEHVEYRADMDFPKRRHVRWLV
ncbi:cell division protein FtsA [Asticcacaulis sp. 201]|uniref:cell division protein FtsA n=1 Tax=Asticcacaulis sp. 201 TaxID=3028787 RepID=UPI002915E8B9|nr:cell division protein FtsA [Asticcacaulis sp. 201]MDV6330629.1 cell division protein FtsA [Asticcacaulis sp. 201]